MSTMRRAAILKMANSAYEMNLDVAKGVLTQDEQGHWQVGGRDIEQWLAPYQGQDLVLVLGSLADERPVQVRTCRTCGRDYTDLECPTCRANRIRLRGTAR